MSWQFRVSPVGSAVPTGKRQLHSERQKVAGNTWKSFSSWRRGSLQYSTAGFGHVKTFPWRGSSAHQQRFPGLLQHVKHKVCEQLFAPAHTSAKTGGSQGYTENEGYNQN